MRTTFVEQRRPHGGAVYVVDQAGFVNSTIVDNSASVVGRGGLVDGASDFGRVFGTITGNQRRRTPRTSPTERGRLLTVIVTVVAEAGAAVRTATRPLAALSGATSTTAAATPAPRGRRCSARSDNGGPTPTRLPCPTVR